LGPEVWEDARRLAEQLDDAAILPLVGAGASYDCGQPLAKDVAEAMYWRYCNPAGWRPTPPPPSDLEDGKGDLGLVADAFFLRGGQEAVIDALSLETPEDWPGVVEFPDHFCTYRVLARLAREGVFSEAISLNYDCGFERGLRDEGFGFSRKSNLRGARWLDHATVITSAKDHFRTDQRGELVLAKAHGCSAAYRREMAVADEKTKERLLEEVIVRRTQLMDWRSDFWARDLFADRARSHVVLLIGVAGQDPVIHIALTRIMQEIFRRVPSGDGNPRVVVIDPSPQTVALESLAFQGCGGKAPSANAVLRLKVPRGRSLTAVLIALAVEILTRRLRASGAVVPEDRQARVISTMVEVPASLRWSYRLERRSHGVDFLQRVNLEASKGRGYVPVGTLSERATRSVRARNSLVEALKLADQSVQESVESSGFLSDSRRGCAFLPLGLSKHELFEASRAEVRSAAQELETPLGLEPILVVRDKSELSYRSALTGNTLTIP
jgi:hypothetical protein